MTFRSLLGFVAVRLRRPCVVQRFGNLRDGVQYGAFAANLRNDLANRRWNIGAAYPVNPVNTIITPQLPSTPASERASHGPAENQTEHPASRPEPIQHRRTPA